MKYKGKIFIPDWHTLGDEYEATLTTDNNDLFLRLCEDKNLELLLEAQIESENYKGAELIKKEIERRKNETSI